MMQEKWSILCFPCFRKYDGWSGIYLQTRACQLFFSASQINSYASCRQSTFERVLDLGSFEYDQGLSPKMKEYYTMMPLNVLPK